MTEKPNPDFGAAAAEVRQVRAQAARIIAVTAASCLGRESSAGVPAAAPTARLADALTLAALLGRRLGYGHAAPGTECAANARPQSAPAGAMDGADGAQLSAVRDVCAPRAHAEKHRRSAPRVRVAAWPPGPHSGGRSGTPQ